MESIIILRFIERLAIVAAGASCMYLGYRLFDKAKEKQGKLEIKTGKSIALKMSDVAPGIYFCAFGTLLLAYSVFSRMDIHRPSGETSGVPDANWGNVSYSRRFPHFTEQRLAEKLPPEQRTIYLSLCQKENILDLSKQAKLPDTFRNEMIETLKADLSRLPLEGEFRKMYESAVTDDEIIDVSRSYKSFVATMYLDRAIFSENGETDDESPNFILDSRYSEFEERTFVAGRLNAFCSLLMINEALGPNAQSHLPQNASLDMLRQIVSEAPFKTLLDVKHNSITLGLFLRSYIPYYFHTYSRPVQKDDVKGA